MMGTRDKNEKHIIYLQCKGILLFMVVSHYNFYGIRVNIKILEKYKFPFSIRMLDFKEKVNNVVSFNLISDAFIMCNYYIEIYCMYLIKQNIFSCLWFWKFISSINTGYYLVNKDTKY